MILNRVLEYLKDVVSNIWIQFVGGEFSFTSSWFDKSIHKTHFDCKIKKSHLIMDNNLENV